MGIALSSGPAVVAPLAVTASVGVWLLDTSPGLALVTLAMILAATALAERSPWVSRMCSISTATRVQAALLCGLAALLAVVLTFVLPALVVVAVFYLVAFAAVGAGLAGMVGTRHIRRSDVLLVLFGLTALYGSTTERQGVVIIAFALAGLRLALPLLVPLREGPAAARRLVEVFLGAK